MTDRPTIRETLEQAQQRLGPDHEEARLEASVLLARAMGKSRTHLLAWPDKPLDRPSLERFEASLRRRMGGEPIAYITGEREFWSLPLITAPGVLIPRPDTETLVEQALALIPCRQPWRIADLGTGSGAIALAVAHERPDCTVLASDRSERALTTARENARRLEIPNVRFALGDWCEVLDGNDWDLILSNPPYVAPDDPHLLQGDLRAEPREALVAGEQGLADLRRIAGCARRHLRDGGWLMLEHGYAQGQAARALFDEFEYRDLRTTEDYAGQPRMTRGCWMNE